MQKFIIRPRIRSSGYTKKINSEFIEVGEKFYFSSDSLCHAAKTLKTYKYFNAISILNI